MNSFTLYLWFLILLLAGYFSTLKFLQLRQVYAYSVNYEKHIFINDPRLKHFLIALVIFATSCVMFIIRVLKKTPTTVEILSLIVTFLLFFTDIADYHLLPAGEKSKKFNLQDVPIEILAFFGILLVIFIIKPSIIIEYKYLWWVWSSIVVLLYSLYQTYKKNSPRKIIFSGLLLIVLLNII